MRKKLSLTFGIFALCSALVGSKYLNDITEQGPESWGEINFPVKCSFETDDGTQFDYKLEKNIYFFFGSYVVFTEKVNNVRTVMNVDHRILNFPLLDGEQLVLNIKTGCDNAVKKGLTKKL